MIRNIIARTNHFASLLVFNCVISTWISYDVKRAVFDSCHFVWFGLVKQGQGQGRYPILRTKITASRTFSRGLYRPPLNECLDLNSYAIAMRADSITDCLFCIVMSWFGLVWFGLVKQGHRSGREPLQKF